MINMIKQSWNVKDRLGVSNQLWTRLPEAKGSNGTKLTFVYVLGYFFFVAEKKKTLINVQVRSFRIHPHHSTFVKVAYAQLIVAVTRKVLPLKMSCKENHNSL